MNGSEQLNSELTTTLEYLIDKFNLTLEVSSEQIKDFSVQMAEKIITWEFITSLLAIAGWIIVVLVAIRLHEYFNIESFAQLNKIYNAFLDMKGSKEEIDRLVFKYSIKIVVIFILIICAICIACEIKDILMCAVFPEKVILEFISSYL